VSGRTRYLSRLMGLYCLLAGVIMLVHREGMIAAVEELVLDRPLLLILGVIIVAVGLAMVLAHNVWSGGALPVVVTLIGWLTMLKGLVLWLLSPQAAAQLYLQQLHYAQLYYLYAAVTLALGVYLTLAGFRPAPRAA
jgi:vacuolar-type H+-ATPase subunit I/STV1